MHILPFGLFSRQPVGEGQGGGERRGGGGEGGGHSISTDREYQYISAQLSRHSNQFLLMSVREQDLILK